MTDLDKLIERVEAGEIDFAHFLPTEELDVLRGCFPMEHFGNFISAYSGSVDAALALKAELLGAGWCLTIRESWSNAGQNIAELDKMDKRGTSSVHGIDNRGYRLKSVHALLAILKAYQWEKEQ